MAVVTPKRTAALLDLVREGLPVRVESDGDFEDWNVMAPAKLAIVTKLFEGVVGSIPPDNRFRAEVLGRSLAEHAIAFAWLAANDGERERRLKQMVRGEFESRSRAGNQLGDQIYGKERYENLFETGRVPRVLLESETQSRLEELRNSEIPTPPGVLDMALAADSYWVDRSEIIAHNPFALVYFVLFTGPSFVTHTSITAVSRFVDGDPPHLTVGRERANLTSESPYGQSMMTFVNCLLVASETLGWPSEEAIVAAMNVDSVTNG